MGGAKPISEEFVWTEKRSRAAVLLAQGYSTGEVAEEIGMSRSAVYWWTKKEDFGKAVDELSLIHGIASKAYRLRLLNKAIRQKIQEDGNLELDGVSFMEIIKEARMQTEGIRLGILEKLVTGDEAAGLMAGDGPGGSTSLPDPEAEQAE